jgi:DNA-binding winged helix-turn-helix (wHTH) protein/tetratricopeptide (TPR) repeat protein
LHGTSPTVTGCGDLAEMPDMRLGSVLVRPSLHQIVGPGGAESVEPQVMRVLLALIEAGGAVVSRQMLFRRCWPGIHVSEDSLNRAIAEARRVVRSIGTDDLRIETLPRTGYRLASAPVEIVPPPAAGQNWPDAPDVPEAHAGADGRPSRRRVIAGTALAAAIVSGGFWWRRNIAADQAVAALVDEAEMAFGHSDQASLDRAMAALGKAVERDPGDARAWGMMAYGWSQRSTEFYGPAAAKAVDSTRQAASRAMAMAPHQPDARLALALLQPTYGDWLASEQKLRAIMASHPEHVPTLAALAFLLMSVGRVTEALALNRRAFALQPLYPPLGFRIAYGLWATGRLAEADRMIERGRELWPGDANIALARFLTFAFTDRIAAARALVDRSGPGGMHLSPAAQARFRLALAAMTSRAPADVAAATAAWRRVASISPFHAINATLLFTGIGPRCSI